MEEITVVARAVGQQGGIGELSEQLQQRLTDKGELFGVLIIDGIGLVEFRYDRIEWNILQQMRVNALLLTLQPDALAGLNKKTGTRPFSINFVMDCLNSL